MLTFFNNHLSRFFLFSRRFMTRKITTLFLLLVLSIQMMPIQQMGNALFCNQFTEEIPHSLDADRDFSKKTTCHSDYLSTGPLAIELTGRDIIFQHRDSIDPIPENHTRDIDVPPPNC